MSWNWLWSWKNSRRKKVLTFVQCGPEKLCDAKQCGGTKHANGHKVSCFLSIQLFEARNGTKMVRIFWHHRSWKVPKKSWSLSWHLSGNPACSTLTHLSVFTAKLLIHFVTMATNGTISSGCVSQSLSSSEPMSNEHKTHFSDCAR